METFFSFLNKRVDDCSSLICVGLDPHPDDLPAASVDAALDFCKILIKGTAPYAAAFKPNAAFFEVYGAEGWIALKEVIAAVQVESERQGSMIPVILDAKRGDIASTAAAYARSAFDHLGAHAITLSPFLGRDSIEPFLEYKEKGVFLLCKTTNPGAADLQDLRVITESVIQAHQEDHTSFANHSEGPRSIPLYEHIARLAQTWNSGNNIGLVIGANQPEALSHIRTITPDLWYLVPGIGIQGGDLRTALKAGLRKDGKGMLISISRGISRTKDPSMTASGLRDEIINIKYEISRNA